MVFPTGDVMFILFYITSLNLSASAVLEFDWLDCYNPLIDLSSWLLTFWTVEQKGSPSSSPVLDQSGLAQDHTLSIDNTLIQPPPVSLINAAAFAHVAQLEGSQVFQFLLQAASFDKFKSNLDLDSVPSEYHNFTDVFSEV